MGTNRRLWRSSGIFSVISRQHICLAKDTYQVVAMMSQSRIAESARLARLETHWVYAAVISLPLASRPSSANPARDSETTTTVIASTAG